tara:strand:+ start:174 stop:416 length:243 start_codon:yes stop_codon:yes gene_type:complete
VALCGQYVNKPYVDKSCCVGLIVYRLQNLKNWAALLACSDSLLNMLIDFTFDTKNNSGGKALLKINITNPSKPNTIFIIL